MGMGVVSDKEFNLERNKFVKSDTTNQPEITAEIIDSPKLGRPPGTKEVPNSLRQVIGEESAINGRAGGLAIAEHFGISPSSVSAYNKGATSTKTYDDRPNQSHINDAKMRVSNKARHKLMCALKHITEDKLAVTRVTDLAGIAKNMSSIMKDMEPESAKSNQLNQPTFVFYSPQFKKEEHFDVVKVDE